MSDATTTIRAYDQPCGVCARPVELYWRTDEGFIAVHRVSGRLRACKPAVQPDRSKP